MAGYGGAVGGDRDGFGLEAGDAVQAAAPGMMRAAVGVVPYLSTGRPLGTASGTPRRPSMAGWAVRLSRKAMSAATSASEVKMVKTSTATSSQAVEAGGATAVDVKADVV